MSVIDELVPLLKKLRLSGVLQASRADNSHEKRLVRFAEVDLLVIDDLGLPRQAPPSC